MLPVLLQFVSSVVTYDRMKQLFMRVSASAAVRRCHAGIHRQWALFGRTQSAVATRAATRSSTVRTSARASAKTPARAAAKAPARAAAAKQPTLGKPQGRPKQRDAAAAKQPTPGKPLGRPKQRAPAAAQAEAHGGAVAEEEILMLVLPYASPAGQEGVYSVKTITI